MEQTESEFKELTYSDLQISGSLVSKNRETTAVIAEKNVNTDGFIFAPSKKEVYDIDELKKVKELEINELISTDEEVELDLVPSSLYEEALESLSIAEETIDIQSSTIAELETKISELEIRVETLLEEVDNEKLQRILAEENFENARQEISVITQESQLSYQRSILEGIEKTSLEAKNEGLIAQNESLRDEIANKQSEIDQLQKSLDGKDAQIEAGAKASTELTVNVLNKGAEDKEDILLDSISFNTIMPDRNDTNKFNPPYEIWINGPDLELYNPTNQTQKISIDVSGVAGGWLKSVTNFSMNPNETKKITLLFDRGKIVSLDPSNRAGNAKNYSGKIIIKSNTTQLSLSSRMYKHTSR